MCESDPDREVVGFHYQQTAEKYLKALLEERTAPIPKTHDLKRVLALLTPAYPQLRRHQRAARPLSWFAVFPRYPGANVKLRQLVAARRWANGIRDDCRAILGLPP